MKTNCRVCNIARKESHQLKRVGGVRLGFRLSRLHAELLTQGLATGPHANRRSEV